MMRRLAAAILVSSFTAGVFAACSKEAAPSIPDGKKASDSEMTATQQVIKAYMASANAYLQCLDAEESAAGKEEDKTAKVARTERYNAAVDEQAAIAATWNATVKAFKAR